METELPDPQENGPSHQDCVHMSEKESNTDSRAAINDWSEFFGEETKKKDKNISIRESALVLTDTVSVRKHLRPYTSM